MKTVPAKRAIDHRFSTGNIAAQSARISLQQLVNQLLANSMATAFRQQSLVLNEVSRDVLLEKDELLAAPVLRDLLSAVISNSRNGQIYITAEKFRTGIILQLQDRNNYNGYALTSSLALIEAEAVLTGASLTIAGARQKVVTISFTFPHHPERSHYDC